MKKETSKAEEKKTISDIMDKYEQAVKDILSLPSLSDNK